MSFAAIAGIFASIATIVGGIVYFVKYSSWSLTKTPAQTDAEIDQQNQKDKHDAQETGRPV